MTKSDGGESVSNEGLSVERLSELLHTIGSAIADQAAEALRFREAITWALGANGEFRPQGTMEGRYWWRGELAERAGLSWDGGRYVSAPTVELSGERSESVSNGRQKNLERKL